MMKYPYDLARQLRADAQEHPSDGIGNRLFYEAAGTLEFMAELLTQPQRDPPKPREAPFQAQPIPLHWSLPDANGHGKNTTSWRYFADSYYDMPQCSCRRFVMRNGCTGIAEHRDGVAKAIWHGKESCQ